MILSFSSPSLGFLLYKKKRSQILNLQREKCWQQLLVATMASLFASLGSLSSYLSPKSKHVSYVPLSSPSWDLLCFFFWLVSLSPSMLKNGRSWQEKEGDEEEKEIRWVHKPWWRRNGCGEIPWAMASRDDRVRILEI